MKSSTSEKGSAIEIAAVWRASRPPPARSTAATVPSNKDQKMRCQTGGFVDPPELSISITRDPESEDVTKNVTITVVAIKLTITEKGNESRKTKSAVVMFSLTAFISVESPKSVFRIPVEPKAVSHTKLKAVGMNNTPEMNSLMVLPFETRAMNIPTYGDHEIHQLQ